MAVRPNNIPRKWDVVSDVIYSDNNTRAKIVFNTGASITVKIAMDDDYSPKTPKTTMVHKRPPKVVIKKIPNKKPAQPKIMTPEMQQEAYRHQAMRALQEMGGSSESLKAAMMTPMVDPQFELMKQRALAESESKSAELANSLTPLVPGNIPVNNEVQDRFYFEKQQ